MRSHEALAREEDLARTTEGTPVLVVVSGSFAEGGWTCAEQECSPPVQMDDARSCGPTMALKKISEQIKERLSAKHTYIHEHGGTMRHQRLGINVSFH